MSSNCQEDSWESLGLQGDQTSQSQRKWTLYWKWIFIGRSELKMKLQYFGHPMRRAISLERTFCWEGLRAGGEGGHRGWGGWMASLTWWTWFLANSRRQARTGRPGVPHSTELQGGRQDLVTEQQQQSPEVPDLANKKYCQWCTGHILRNLFDICLKIKFNWMFHFTWPSCHLQKPFWSFTTEYSSGVESWWN